MSNYALPPESPSLAAAATDLVQESQQQQIQQSQQQQQQHQDGSPHQQSHQPHPQPQLYPSLEHNGLASPTSQATATAIATAHHGLQALQAATDIPSSAAPGSLTPSYSVAPSLASPLVDGQYVGMATHSHSPPVQQQPQQNNNPKVTRLRRACDMCSSRKVKVCRLSPCC